MEIFQNEIYRLSGKSGVAFDLDAAACYDRILAALASLASQKYGMHYRVALVNAITLEEARFKLKTKLGPSARYYKHEVNNPIHGTGQGSQNSPTIWLFVCSTLFDAFEEDANGAIFESYDRTESIRIYMVGFVDDCSQRVNDFRAHPQPSPEILVEKMRKDAQRWNDLLWSSGGLLEVFKCSYHLISSVPDTKGIMMLNPNRCQHELLLLSPTQPEPIRIKSLSAFETHRTLGVWTSPSGSMKTQLRKSQENALRHTRQIGFCTSTKEARTYYHSFYQTSVGYPDCCTSFSAKECHSIEKGFTAKALNYCGYNKNYDRSVTWALAKRGGVGFMGRHTEQGMAKTILALKLLRSNGQPARELRILLSWVQAQAGFSSSLLSQNTHTAIPHLRATWIPSLRNFLNQTGLKINHSSGFSPVAQREHDIFIMEWLLTEQSGKFANEEIRMIAACREYNQITTLSDITMADGRFINVNMWHGPDVPPSPGTRRTHMFNAIAKPPPRAWNLWKRALTPLIIPTHDQRLLQPLGRWLCCAADTRVVWKYAFSPSNNTLFSSDNDGQYAFHQAVRHNRFQCNGTPCDQLPPDSVPATITRIVFPAMVLRLDHWSPMVPPNEPDNGNHHDDLQETIRSMPAWEQHLLSHVETPYSLQALREWYSNNNGIAGSNGTIKGSNASFGWKLCNIDGSMVAQCCGSAPGLHPSRLRVTAYGHLSFTRFLLLLERDEMLTHPQPQRLHTDCKSLIQRIKDHRKYRYEVPSNALWSDWDVTSALHFSLKGVRGKLKACYSIFQAPDLQNPGNPTIPAQINADSRTLALQYIQEHPEPATFAYHFPSTGATLDSPLGTLSANYKTEIRDSATWPQMKAYLTRRFDWEPNVAGTIDWSALSTALSTHRSHQPTLVKHLTRQAPTGHIAHRNDKREDPSCFACNAAFEDNNHILRCPDDTAATWRVNYLKNIGDAFALPRLRSDPMLIRIMQDGMERWLLEIGSPLPSNPYPDRYHHLINEQNSIGWDQPLRGRLSISWGRLQEEYLTNQNLNTAITLGQAWARLLATHGLTWWLKRWKTRNQVRFGDTPGDVHMRKRRQIQREITLLYAQQPDMRDSDRYIFLPSVEAHMATSPDDNLPLQNWINLNEPAIRQSIRARIHPPHPP